MVRRGNTDSFADIIERYQSPVFRYLYRLTGNFDASLDLSQGTFLRAYKGIIKDEVKISFKAWLYRIATNNALQFLRRKRTISFVPLKHVSEKDIAQIIKQPPGKQSHPSIEFAPCVRYSDEWEARTTRTQYFGFGTKFLFLPSFFFSGFPLRLF